MELSKSDLQVFPLARETTTCGRQSGEVLFPEDPTVSPRHCATCGAEIKPEDQYFSAERGGVLCPKCGMGQPGVHPITMPALKILRHFQRSRYAEARRARLHLSIDRERLSLFRFEHEMALAHELQHSVLPASLPAVPGLEMGLAFRLKNVDRYTTLRRGQHPSGSKRSAADFVTLADRLAEVPFGELGPFQAAAPLLPGAGILKRGPEAVQPRQDLPGCLTGIID